MSFLKDAEELFETIDKQLIEGMIDERLSEASNHHFNELKKQGLTGEELTRAHSTAMAVESVRQSTFIACLLKSFDPDDYDPKDFLTLVK
ncbi:hypothetical protein MUN89_15870 [Halobacillus salinarum]|uniref:Uncharacterized protein n=1 Tax=Halobacillus salinarum TaxID=2932257 RepID=A0ABY4EFY1_9BACI|nr:hypothetical protein [Halobacillus salinarum]UOQ43386.1 hypothetical protein MUN89_15870 [Halobacillus salinarum]